MSVAVDEGKLEALMGQLVGHMTGSALCFGIWLGDELGLYRTMAELGETSAEDLATKTGCHPRLVRVRRRRSRGARRDRGSEATAQEHEPEHSFVVRARGAAGSRGRS